MNQVTDMTLLNAQEGKEYIIKQIVTDDEEMDAFLAAMTELTQEA